MCENTNGKGLASLRHLVDLHQSEVQELTYSASKISVIAKDRACSQSSEQNRLGVRQDVRGRLSRRPFSSHNSGSAPTLHGSLSGEQLGACRRELHIGSGLVFPQPALGNRVIEPGTVFAGRGAFAEKRQIDLLVMYPAVLYRFVFVGNIQTSALSGRWIGV